MSMISSAGMKPFQRFGTIHLNTWGSVSREHEKQLPLGWTPQYGRPPVFHSRETISRCIKDYYDHPEMNRPRVTRYGDHQANIMNADMQVWRSHQEYINNTPMVQVKAMPMDFNNPMVQDKIESMYDKTAVMEAIRVFETKLAELQLSPQRREELRNDFYRKIVQADQSVLYNIAKDEQGKDIKSILELLTKYTNNDNEGGGRPNIIAPVGGGGVPIVTPVKPPIDDEVGQPDNIEEFVEFMFTKLDIGDGLNDGEKNDVKILVAQELEAIQRAGEKYPPKVDVMKVIFNDAIESIRGLRVKPERSQPDDEKIENAIDNAASDYIDSKPKKGFPKLKNAFKEPGEENLLIQGKIKNKPHLSKISKRMTEALERNKLKINPANRRRLYDAILILEN